MDKKGRLDKTLIFSVKKIAEIKMETVVQRKKKKKEVRRIEYLFPKISPLQDL